jgi:hypothetical protein
MTHFDPSTGVPAGWSNSSAKVTAAGVIAAGDCSAFPVTGMLVSSTAASRRDPRTPMRADIVVTLHLFSRFVRPVNICCARQQSMQV